MVFADWVYLDSIYLIQYLCKAKNTYDHTSNNNKLKYKYVCSDLTFIKSSLKQIYHLIRFVIHDNEKHDVLLMIMMYNMQYVWKINYLKIQIL